MSNTNCNLLNCVNGKLKHVEKYIRNGKICFTELNPAPGCATVGSESNPVCEVYAETVIAENIVQNNNIFPDEPFQNITGNGNTPIDLTPYGTTIIRTMSGFSAHPIPNGTYDGQLKRINANQPGGIPGDIIVDITSPTFGASVFRMTLTNGVPFYQYVLLRWNGSTWVPIDTYGGTFFP